MAETMDKRQKIVCLVWEKEKKKGGGGNTTFIHQPSYQYLVNLNILKVEITHWQIQ